MPATQCIGRDYNKRDREVGGGRGRAGLASPGQELWFHAKFSVKPLAGVGVGVGQL